MLNYANLNVKQIDITKTENKYCCYFIQFNFLNY